MTQFSSFLWLRNIPFYVCNSYLCSSIGKIFFPSGIFQNISLIFHNLNIIYIYISSLFWCLSCLVLSELPGCVVWGLSLYAGSCFKSFLPSFLSFFPPCLSLSVLPSLSPLSYFLSFCYSYYVLVSLFVVVFTVLGYFLLFIPASFLFDF